MIRKKIFFVLPVMKGGGAEKVASVLMNNLDRERFEPTLVLFNKEGEYLKFVPSDVEIIDLNKKNRFDFITLILKLRRLIKEQRPHILLSSLYYPNMIIVLSRLLLRTPCKIVLSEHSQHKKLLPFKRFSRLVRHLMRFTYRRADKIVAVSNSIKNDLVSDFRIDPERIAVIYNPMETEVVRRLSEEKVQHRFFENLDARFVIISVGRLTRAKNFELLIRSLVRIRHKIPACLLIVGKGELEQELKHLAKRFDVADHVDFVGYQDNPYKWMRKADLFVLASSWEGFGIVLVEAMICGTPVVSTACHESPHEIITDGVDGRVVPLDDEERLSRVIVEIAERDDLRRTLLAGGDENLKRFDASRIVPQYEKIFDDLLGA